MSECTYEQGFADGFERGYDAGFKKALSGRLFGRGDGITTLSCSSEDCCGDNKIGPSLYARREKLTMTER